MKKIKNSTCNNGSGCQVYILPIAATKEVFEKKVKEEIKKSKEPLKKAA